MAGKTRLLENKVKDFPGNESAEVLRSYYQQMSLIRAFELRASEMYARAKIGGYCHLNLGEEATVVGLMAALQPRDYLFASYRDHGYALARGMHANNVMAELFGKTTGVVRRPRRLDAHVRHRGQAARRLRHRRRADSAGDRRRAGPELPQRARTGCRGGHVPAR